MTNEGGGIYSPSHWTNCPCGCNADENQKVGAGGTALTYEEAKAEMIAAAWRYWLDPDEEAAYAAKALADLPAFSAKLDEALEPHNALAQGRPE